MGYSRKNPNMGQGFSTWNFQSRGIEERAHKNPRVQLRRKWNFCGFQRKTDVKFPWVLVFDHGISNFKIVAHNFAEFLGVKKLVFSRIFRKVYLPPHPSTGLKFLWNSPIMDRWVSSKTSNYYNRGMAIGTTSEKIPNKGGGLKTWISWGCIEKLYCGNSRSQLKKELALPGVLKKVLVFWSWKFHGV